MSWPLSQDYNEAIQDPRNSFGDAELKTGEAVANALGIPMPRSGNFADVYEVRCPNGSRWAVKCFTRQVSGLRERYSEIGKYLRLANLPFTVDFKYLEQGIRMRGQCCTFRDFLIAAEVVFRGISSLFRILGGIRGLWKQPLLFNRRRFPEVFEG